MIASILTDPGVGGTFLSWTLYFLKNNQEYYYMREGRYKSLIKNPLTDNNAHAFLSNQFYEVDKLKTSIETLKNNSESQRLETDLHTIYFHYMSYDRPREQKVVQYLNSVSDKQIVLSTPCGYEFFNCNLTDRANLDQKGQFDFVSNPRIYGKDKINWFISNFFKKSAEGWQQNQSLDIEWELREFLALNIRPDEINAITDNTFIKDCFFLKASDCWKNFEKNIFDVFDYLNLEINEPRYNEWLKVYKSWQHNLGNRVVFCELFNEIIDSIINGYDFDLTWLKLDILQEAIIQNFLIYNKGLNIKGYGI